MDFLRNRTFRQTLLTHRGVTLSRHLTGESLRSLHLTGQLHPPEQAADGSGIFKTPVAQPQGHEIRSWQIGLRKSD